jgi:hypothetical protein
LTTKVVMSKAVEIWWGEGEGDVGGQGGGGRRGRLGGVRKEEACALEVDD